MSKKHTAVPQITDPVSGFQQLWDILPVTLLLLLQRPLFPGVLSSAFDPPLRSVLTNTRCGPEFLLPARLALSAAALYKGFLFTARRPGGQEKTVSALYL